MPALFITTPGSRVSLISERLRVEFPPPEDSTESQPPPPRDVPLHDVEHIVADERISLTTPAQCECLRRGIPVVWVDRSQAILGLSQPPARAAGLRRTQHRRFDDPALALSLAALIVEAKIQNGRRVLQRIAANREGADIRDGLGSLEHLRRQCLDATSVDAVRGYEGAAAARYFEILATFFPADCPFPRRSRRPPLDPPNAILSFAYSLLAAESDALLHAAGLDSALGWLHTPDEGRPSLALDLIEPFRAPVADALALDLLGHQTLKPAEHFCHREGGVFLNTEGRRRFFTAYERRLAREFTSEQHGGRTSLRGELRRQVNDLRRTLLDNEPFEPFLMN
jgi:CRISPR-associated protein Cas1